MKFLVMALLAILSISVSFAGRFFVGDTVVFTQSGTHYRATILSLYEDGSAKVSFPDGEFTESQIKVSSLSLPLRVSGAFRLNQRVTFNQSGTNYSAVILALYEDGKAKVSFPNGEFTESEVKISSLSPIVREIGAFRVNETVVFTQSGVHYEAVIRSLYQDNTAKIFFPNGEFTESQVKISSLSKPLSMSDVYKLRDEVVFTQSGVHYDAIIIALYEDGAAKVSFPNGEFSNSDVKLTTLSLRLYQYAQFMINENVVFTQSGVHYEARILALYQDGFAKIEFPNGEFSVSQVKISTLSKHLTSTRR